MMKKTYTKPQILFEDFALSTSISAGCELETPEPSYFENCGYNVDPRLPDIIFLQGTQCNRYPDDGLYNGFCYHNPTDAANLFNS